MSAAPTRGDLSPASVGAPHWVRYVQGGNSHGFRTHGVATEVPSKYVMDMMFRNQNLGQGFAASTMMLLFVMIILIPWTVYEYREKRRG